VATIEDALHEIHRAGGRGGRPRSLRNVRYCRFLLGLALDEAQRRGLIRSNPTRLARIPTREHPERRPRSQPQQPWSVASCVSSRGGRRRSPGRALDHLRPHRCAPPRVARRYLGRRGPRRRDPRDQADACRGPDGRPTDRVRQGQAQDVDVTHRDARRRQRRRPAGAPSPAGGRTVAANTAGAGEDRIFCREDGSGLDPDRVSAQFRKRCETAGVRRVRLHDIRHAMATLMLAAGIRVEVVSKRLGHARISVPTTCTPTLTTSSNGGRHPGGSAHLRAAAGRRP
jgi:hypothetical protein